jgi:hypothetical protein
MQKIVAALLIFAGLVNFFPAIGLCSASFQAQLYGISEPTGDLLILLRHRALLFGMLGCLILVSAFRRQLQPLAILGGLVSMLGFVAVALAVGGYGPEIGRAVAIDVVASIGLVAVIFLRGKK